MITDAAIIANSDALKAGWVRPRMTWLDHDRERTAAARVRWISVNRISARQCHQNEHRNRMLWYENRADGSI